MSEGQSAQEHPSNFQKILNNILGVDEKVEEKIRILVLLASLLYSYEFLMTALLMIRASSRLRMSLSHFFKTRFLGRRTKF